MTTEQLKREIVEMLDAFMDNSFLIPSTWSEERNFSTTEGSFRTYANEERDYLSIELRFNGKYVNKTFRKRASTHEWEVEGNDLLTCASVEEQLKELHKWLKAIHETLLPQKTQETLAKIEKLKKQIEEYEKELEDAADQN